MKRLGSRCSIALLVALSTLDPSLAQTTKVVPVIPLRTSLTSGAVQDGTYKNESLGLQFTPPPGLKFGAPELKGRPGTVPLLVTIAAWSDPPSANGGTIFYADHLGYYAVDRRSTKAYVERVVRNRKAEGLELVEGQAEGRLGGVTFARMDFHDASSYQVVFVKACDVYAFVFIFAASDSESANRLIAHTTVNLDMKTSGCGEATASTPQPK